VAGAQVEKAFKTFHFDLLWGEQCGKHFIMLPRGDRKLHKIKHLWVTSVCEAVYIRIYIPTIAKHGTPWRMSNAANRKKCIIQIR